MSSTVYADYMQVVVSAHYLSIVDESDFASALNKIQSETGFTRLEGGEIITEEVRPENFDMVNPAPKTEATQESAVTT